MAPMPVSFSVVLVAIGMSAELASASGNQALDLSQTSAKNVHFDHF